MLSKINSAALQGIEAIPVLVEVSLTKGVGASIVGLPDTAVKESYQRIMTILDQKSLISGHKRVMINLSPADLRKEGAAFDLPIILGMLAAAGIFPIDALDDTMILGELSLDGRLLPVKGALPAAVLARKMQFKRMIVPADNVTEAAVVNNVDVYGLSTLEEAILLAQGTPTVEPTRIDTRAIFRSTADRFDVDFSEVKGQDSVKRAFEVACAGGHNLLMTGPPGAGKSMMAKRIPTILPPLTMAEALETTKIHSVAGKLHRGSMLMTQRPFRTPHHTISPVALVGGGTNPMPGEISLAHNGVLFLDEFPEFSRQVLEVMRQPIEDRVITVSRAKYTVDYPASFMLVASMNPCPCGYFGHPTRVCTCTPAQVARYMGRISGPLLDRIDIQIDIQPVEFDDIADKRPAESSAAIRARVVAARAIQAERFAAYPEIHCNAQMNSRHIHEYAWPDPNGLKRLKDWMTKLNMSARAFDRILRVARTIADLDYAASGMDNAEAARSQVLSRHISEAIAYRTLDRGI